MSANAIGGVVAVWPRWPLITGCCFALMFCTLRWQRYCWQLLSYYESDERSAFPMIHYELLLLINNDIYVTNSATASASVSFRYRQDKKSTSPPSCAVHKRPEWAAVNIVQKTFCRTECQCDNSLVESVLTPWHPSCFFSVCFCCF